MIIYNPNQIVSIKIDEEGISCIFKYHPYSKKTWWKDEEIEGFYNFLHVYTKEELEESPIDGFEYRIIDNIVYKKARVIITFTNNEKLFYYFDNNLDAKTKAFDLSKRHLTQPIIL